MASGVDASDADAFLFVDADCTGLTGAHLDAICEPFLDGRAVLSLGAFDYGPFWNPMVLRWPPLSGERIIPRWVWDAIPPHKLDGYTIEVRINEVIAERRLRTVARTMKGVYHRTKRVKLGRSEGAAPYMDDVPRAVQDRLADRRRAAQDVLVLPARAHRRAMTRGWRRRPLPVPRSPTAAPGCSSSISCVWPRADDSVETDARTVLDSTRPTRRRWRRAEGPRWCGALLWGRGYSRPKYSMPRSVSPA